jgi:hypothetical protein
MNLLSGDKDERNILQADITSTATSLTLSGANEGAQPGAYLGIDLEVLYVVDTNDASNSVTVTRGELGSVAAAHTAGTRVYVNPRFSRWQMVKALNAELRDLSAPPNMIFQVKDFTLTTQPVQQTYLIPSANVDIIDTLEIRSAIPDANKSWPRITRNDSSILRNLPTSFSPSGMALRLDVAVYPGQQMQVSYAAPLGEIVDSTTDVFAQTGPPLPAGDSPPLGTAARLMGVREAKRSFTES